jgi:hypothetical protein
MIKKMILGLLLVCGAAGLFAQETLIQEIWGTVEVKAAGEAEWKAARQGQTLERGALISTGFNSGALIISGSSKVTLRPLSRLSVEELAAAGSGEKVDINLLAGGLRVSVQPPAGGRVSFNVRSPIATASVRGTEFEFDGVRVRVEEGRVHMSGNSGGGGAYVSAGHIGRVDSESGRAAGAAETAREELAPPPPAGTGNGPGTPKAAPVTADIEAGFEWR